MMSFERIRSVFGDDLSDESLRQIVSENKSLFRPAIIKGNKPGLAKLIP
jgi:hypothetical protein